MSAARRLALAVISMAVLLSMTVLHSPIRAADDRPLKWAADAEGGAPYIFVNPDAPDERIGFEVEFAAELAKKLGRPIEFQQYGYDSLISGLKRGDFDFAMNGLEVTPDRSRELLFSRPYYINRLQAVVRAEETRFQRIEQCKDLGLTVGVLGETMASRWLQKQGIKVQDYDGQLEPLQDLTLGRIDAVLLDLPPAVHYVRPNPRLKFLGDSFEQCLYAIAFRKEQTALADEVNAAINQLVQDGSLKRIYEKWGIWNDDQSLLEQSGSWDELAKMGGTGFSWSRSWSLLASSALMTIKLSIASMALAMIVGLAVAMCRLYGPTPVRWLAVMYVEFFRGIPILLLLYLLYFGIPTVAEQFGWTWLRPSNIFVAILAFGLNYAAYESEIYRGGISSIPQGQWEAAASLGMSWWQTFRRIVFPQTIRIILPPVTNDFVALFKDTSVVSSIAVVELTKQYQLLAKSNLRYLEVGLMTAILYLMMSIPLGYLARRLEEKWGKGL